MSTTEDLPPKGSIWLVGDHYHGWMAFERKPGVDNDPEHQPSHVELHRQPRFYYAPGGAWYVKKFLDRAWGADLSNGRAITLACSPNDEQMGAVFRRPEAFAPYSSTVSFTLDAYPKKPDGPADDKAFRIKSHYGYHSTHEAIRKDREALKHLRELKPSESEACRSKLDEVARIEREYHQSAVTYLDAFRSLTKGSRPRLLIIDDMDMGFRDYEGFAGDFNDDSQWGSFLREHFPNDSSMNHILVLLGRSLPALGGDQTDDTVSDITRAEQSTGLWAQLTVSHRDQTIIIVNADLLRNTGAPINKRTAWERTAEDCIAALKDSENAKLRLFGLFAHIIIRCGITGAIHCYREGPGEERVADLYYDSKADGGFFRDVDKEGGIVGNNSVFTACVARHLLDPTRSRTPTQAIGAGIAAAIPTCQRFFRGGYLVDPDKAAAGLLEEWSDPQADLFIERSYKPGRHKGSAPTHSTLVNVVRIEDKSTSERWYIAAHIGKNRLHLARDIVKRGVSVALNNPSTTEEQRIFAPLGSFGNLKTIDRDELEGFYAISNVIRQYLEVISKNPLAGPMSIAVFGPPGSGKSFTVREIIKSVDPTVERNFSEINMAQLSSSKELSSHLLKVHDVISVGKTPLVFFDEFDCGFDNWPLGWLKYFLAPMEGGTFKHPDEGVFRLGRGIFVFAGGTAVNYREFEKQSSKETKDKDTGQEFKDAKGPDFLSRLRGHVNIKGINFAPFPGEKDDKLYPLRRAVILRSILRRTGLVTEVDKIAQIDNSLLDALLILRDEKGEKAQRPAVFKYDTRSLKTIIDMCLRLHGRIEKASLPPRALLDMHTESGLLYDEMTLHPDLKDTTNDRQSMM